MLQKLCKKQFIMSVSAVGPGDAGSKNFIAGKFN